MTTQEQIISQFEAETSYTVKSIRIYQNIAFFNTVVGAYWAKINTRGIAKNSIRVDNDD